MTQNSTDKEKRLTSWLKSFKEFKCKNMDIEYQWEKNWITVVQTTSNLEFISFILRPSLKSFFILLCPGVNFRIHSKDGFDQYWPSLRNKTDILFFTCKTGMDQLKAFDLSKTQNLGSPKDMLSLRYDLLCL